MNKTKKIYFMLMLISVFLVSTLCFSYAFFTSKTEGNGKLNIVAGTLNYKIESEDLENNKITLSANEIKEIEIELTSLNDIDSKYELYYTSDNSNVRIGYSNDTLDSVADTITANDTKTITIVLRNESSSSATITFGVMGGLKNNDLALKEGNSLNKVVGKYTAYDIGEEITLTDGSKWHVLESSSEIEETVVLLSDYNLNSDGSYNTECGRDINSTYRCSVRVFDEDNTNTYDETDSNNIGYFIKNIYEPLVTTSLPGTTNVTLPTAEQIAAADNQVYNQLDLNLTTSWILTTNYWTKSSLSNSDVVGGIYSEDLYLGHYYATHSIHFGARPTITVPKKYIVDTITSTTTLAIGDSVETIDGSRWHVLETSGSDSKYVTLLSDYNLNSDGSYNTSCQGVTGDVTSYRCSPIAFDTDNTNSYDEMDSNNIGYFIKNTYSPLVTNLLTETTNVTLPTAEQIATADGQVFSQSSLSLISAWLKTTNYWTQTANISNANYVWLGYGYYSNLYYDYANITSAFGARPVITTLKTNIVKPTTSAAVLNIGDAVTAKDGSKWHVLENSGSSNNYVTLLSDYNLNSDGSYNIECGADINSTYTCSVMAFDADDTNIYDETDSNNIGYFIKNTYNPKVINSLLGTTNVTLPTASQIALVDNQTFNQSGLNLTSTWLLTTRYWTKTSNSSSAVYVWLVGGDVSYLGYNTASNSIHNGARPVITTPKSNLILD